MLSSLINKFVWLSSLINKFVWLSSLINKFVWLSSLINKFVWSSSLINKFVWLCELRHGLSTGATCTNTNLKERQQMRSLIRYRNSHHHFLSGFSTPVGCSTHSSSSRTQAKLAQSAGAYPGQSQHEATKSNATPSNLGCLSNAGPPPCRSPPPLPEFCQVVLV